MTKATNPFVLVDADLEAAAFTAARGSAATANRHLREANAALDTIIDELGGVQALNNPEGIDMSRISSIAGDQGEKVQKIVELHSVIAGATRALSELRCMAHSPEWRQAQAEGREVDESVVDPRTAWMQPRQQAFDATVAAFGGTWPGVEGSQRGPVEVPVELLGALFQTTDGFPPFVTPTGQIAFAQIRQPQIMDLFGPPIPTSQSAVGYYRETITAENVEERAEGAAAQESDISYALVNEPIRMIAGSIPVTEEQLDDVPTVRALLEGRLTYLGIRRLDKQLARGDGTGVNIKGLSGRRGDGVGLVRSGKTGATFTPEDPTSDIRKAMTEVRSVGESVPTAAIIAPDQWEAIQLVKTDGAGFLFGRPQDALVNRIWGLPVAESDEIRGKALRAAYAANDQWGVIGDFTVGADIYYRQTAQVEIGRVDKDFVEFKYTLRIGLRACLAVYRPQSFVYLGASA